MTQKKKFLYLLETEHALKFFNGGRSLESVLSKNDSTKVRFYDLYGKRYVRVRDYFLEHSETVEIVDVARWLPALAQ